MPSIRLGDIEWFYRLSGADNSPTIVLLHGFTGSSEVWGDVESRLRTNFRCLIPDLPGHGQTTGPLDVASFSLGTVAAELTELCSALGVRDHVVWGYSMGGRLALRWAVDHPSPFRALILESASPGIADAAEREARRIADDRLAEHINEIGVEAFAEEWIANTLFASQSQLPASRREHGLQIRRKNSVTGLAMSLRGMGSGSQEPLHDALGTLTMPTLVLAGSLDEKFCGIGDAMSAVIPRASFRIVSGAGHAVSWERPEACVEIIQSYLGRLGIPPGPEEG